MVAHRDLKFVAYLGDRPMSLKNIFGCSDNDESFTF
jgi:hypothetical protein